MSYEGEERALCRNGHLHEYNCYASPLGDKDWKCEFCNEPMAWFEDVDWTNGDGIRTQLKEYRPKFYSPDYTNQHCFPQYYIPWEKKSFCFEKPAKVPYAICELVWKDGEPLPNDES